MAVNAKNAAAGRLPSSDRAIPQDGGERELSQVRHAVRKQSVCTLYMPVFMFGCVCPLEYIFIQFIPSLCLNLLRILSVTYVS